MLPSPSSHIRLKPILHPDHDERGQVFVDENEADILRCDRFRGGKTLSRKKVTQVSVKGESPTWDLPSIYIHLIDAIYCIE